jgi:cell division initiation protein
MAITSADIRDQGFDTAKHGYNAQEVDVFLERVAVEIDNFNLALSESRDRYEAAEKRAAAAEQKLKEVSARLQAEPEPKKSVTASATEEQISRAFIAAQRSADALREEARQEAEKAYRESENRARDIVRDALAEKQRILNEVERLRESCEKFRTDYLSLINHFQADASKNLPAIDSFKPDVSGNQLDDAARALLAENDAAAKPQAARSQSGSLASSSRQAAAPSARAKSDSGDFAASPRYIDVGLDIPASVEDDLDIEEID